MAPDLLSQKCFWDLSLHKGAIKCVSLPAGSADSWASGHIAHSSYQLFPKDPWAPAGASTSLEQEALFTLSWSLVLIHKREKSPLGKGQGAWKLFKSESFETSFCCCALLVDTVFQNIKTHALWTG